MSRTSKIAAASVLAVGGLLPVQGASAQEQRVEITGSSIQRVDAEGALPVQVITRKDIEKSGVVNVEQLMQSISANASSGGLTASSASAGPTGGISAISLHGLTSLRTLVLINGRRAAPYGTGFLGDSVSVDVNSIPLSAIERVEVLKDGASAVYGSDAIAGVVNFILRRDYSGLELSASRGDTTDGGGDAQRVSATWGRGDIARDGFNLLLGASFQKEGALVGRQRSFASSGINVDALNDVNSVHSFPANIVFDIPNPAFNPGLPVDPNANPQFLTLAGNPGAPACPPPYAGLDPFFGPDLCVFDPSPFITLLPETERTSVFGSFRLALNADHELFAEFSYNRNKQRTIIHPVPISEQFALPANHPLFNVAPYNGFQTIVVNPGDANYPTAFMQNAVGAGNPLVPIRVFYRSAATGNRDFTDVSEAPRGVLGLSGSFGGWSYDTALLHSQSKVTETIHGGFPLLSAILPILNNGTVNFWAPNAASIDVQLKGTEFLGEAFSVKSSLSSLQGKVTRDLLPMGGGPLAVALGAELRHEDYLFNPGAAVQAGDLAGYGGNFLVTDRSRNVQAAFGELVAPVARNLEFSGAVRYDHYQGVGDATTPKFSLRWKPAEQALVRGSVGRGFRAPGLQELYLPNTQGFTNANLDDPLRCPTTQNLSDCQAQFNVLFGGNADLKPEKSLNRTLGLVLQPTRDVSLAVDWFQVKLKNTINTLDAPFILANLAKYGYLVTRGPVDPAFPDLPGPIVQIDQTNLNLGSTNVAGLDVDGRAGFAAGAAGRFSIGLTGTYFIRYDTENPDGTFTPRVDEIDPNTGSVIPRWKHRLVADWTQGPWTLTLAQNFQKSYRDIAGTLQDPNDPAFVPRRVGSYETYDAQVAYTGVKNLWLALGVRNLFNRPPPYTNAGGQLSFQVGYDPQYGDPRGRFIYLTAKYEHK